VRASALSRYLDRLPDLWGTPASYLRDAGAIVLILAVCAAAASAGAVHTKIFGHDIFVFLDGGWRVTNGQRPNTDFSPGIGTLLPLLMAASLKLAHNSVNAVGYASALVGAVVGFWSYAIGRRRMAWPPAILISLLLTLIAVAPYPLGLLPNMLSHAMIYNRYGYALLGVVVLEAFQKNERDPNNKLIPGGVSTGIITAALLFLKPSFGLVALVFVLCSVLMDLRNRWRPIAILLGLTAGTMAVMAWLRFDFAAVWSSFRLLAAAKSTGLSGWQIRWALAKGLPDFAWLALLAVLVGVIRAWKEPIGRAFRAMPVAVLVVAGGALLLASNAQAGGYPLNAVLAILLAEQGRIAARESGIGLTRGFLRADSVVLLVAVLCFAPTLVANASGLTYAVLDSRRNPAASEVARFQSAPLRDLALYDVPDGTDADYRSNGRVYVTYVNDGMDLIRRTSIPDETVFTLDMVNPFSYALERRPAHGGTDCIDVDHQFNDTHKPTPEWLFGFANIVMVPKHPAAAALSTVALRRNYLAAVQSEFRLCAESSWWQLYKRPSNLEGCTSIK